MEDNKLQHLPIQRQDSVSGEEPEPDSYEIISDKNTPEQTGEVSPVPPYPWGTPPNG